MFQSRHELSEPCLMYQYSLTGSRLQLSSELCRQIIRSAGFIEDYCELVEGESSKKKQPASPENTRSSSLDRESVEKEDIQNQSAEEFLQDPRIHLHSKRIYKLEGKKSFLVRSVSKRSKTFLLDKIRKFMCQDKITRFVSEQFRRKGDYQKRLREVKFLKEKNSSQSNEFKISILKIEKDLGMIERYLGNVPTKME